MFEKIVVVDSTGLNTWGVERLKELGKEVVFYTGIPETDEEIVNRIGDADCVLVSYNTQIRRNVIEACPNIKYIGMCCTLYSESSANVDIAAARERGITVLGICDYGDEGVVEYVISELVRLLHGFGGKQWKHKAYELGGQKVGIVGLGRTGRMIADALRFCWHRRWTMLRPCWGLSIAEGPSGEIGDVPWEPWPVCSCFRLGGSYWVLSWGLSWGNFWEARRPEMR